MNKETTVKMWCCPICLLDLEGGKCGESKGCDAAWVAGKMVGSNWISFLNHLSISSKLIYQETNNAQLQGTTLRGKMVKISLT